ncbi:MAG: thiamine pyrophosphate-dependent enzyme [Ignavibacteria bacterium]
MSNTELKTEPKIRTNTNRKSDIDTDILLKAYLSMCTSRRMAEIYDENRQICKYVHSTSRGHEAIQLAAGMQLKEIDYISPYYRDESILLGMGLEPYELMLQLLTKKDDPFSGGRTYYGHPSLKREGFLRSSSVQRYACRQFRLQAWLTGYHILKLWICSGLMRNLSSFAVSVTDL